jgi:uncharacterized protein (DUF2235 family)
VNFAPFRRNAMAAHPPARPDARPRDAAIRAEGADQSRPTKRIVLLSDGTGNSAAKVWRTNVWRLYQALDLSNGRQVALYDDGVGTSTFKPLAILGGAFGWGLKRNVLDLYRFACRNWRDGAEIYAFGFSRGAFTIRVLMGLIARQGLAPVTTEAQLQRDAAAAYREYRRRYTTLLAPLVELLRAIRNVLIDAWNRLFGRPPYDPSVNRQVPSIEFMGLWDTVAAYGAPIDEMTRGVSLWLWPLSLPDRQLNGKVKRARHALALDDERTTFFPVLWTERGEGPMPANIRDERISQVWFTGVHSNVGGGYPDDALAQVSLHWMMTEAEKAGLEFKKGAIEEARLASDEDGRLYDSRYGMGAYYRYCPRKIVELTHERFSNAPHDEVEIAVPKIHESMFKRLRHGARAYAPVGLPADYAVVNAAGDVLRGDANPYETSAQAQARVRLQERVWNLVWGRRVTYFGTLAASAYMVLLPWIHGSVSGPASAWSFLSWPIRTAGALAPAAAHDWIEGFAINPGKFALWGLIVVGLMAIGKRLERRISDHMRSLWLAAPDAAAPPADRLYRLRTHPLYRGFFRLGKHYVLPTILAGLIVLLLVAFASQTTAVVTSSLGLACPHSGTLTPVTATPVVRDGFHTDAFCWPTGLRLRGGLSYRVTIEPTAPWGDRGVPVTDLRGFDTPLSPMLLRLPFRRWLTEPWFRPIARIGWKGTDEYPLIPRLSATDEADDAPVRRLVSVVRARTSGELFLYVNDSMIELPGLRTRFYRNNAGTARVTVELLSRGR